MLYKLISSAAINYNRPLVATETYGAIRNTPVLIRGNMKLETWDPQTGEIKRCNTSTLTQNVTDITRFQLTLDPVKS
jgi:ribosome maturation factor RimP